MKSIFGEKKHSGRPLIVAHRGASRIARENTLEAFEAAIESGADAIECDLRRTADGIIVVHHNATIPLTRRRISRLTWPEACRLAHKRGYDLPTFEEAARLCHKRIALDLELKETGYETEVVRQTFRFLDKKQVLFTSFNDASLTAIKEYDPEAKVGLLLGFRRGRTPAQRRRLFAKARLRACGADVVLPHWQLVRFGFMRRMSALGLPVVTWTVDSPRRAERLLNQGVTGIITNVPDRMLKLVEKTTRRLSSD
jgi:glycerophosphoryl diester phosphodiesterase